MRLVIEKCWANILSIKKLTKLNLLHCMKSNYFRKSCMLMLSSLYIDLKDKKLSIFFDLKNRSRTKNRRGS